MIENTRNISSLLPQGFCDLLPPDAEAEAQLIEILMDVFSAHGYNRVRPAAFEFEDRHSIGQEALGSWQAFRTTDPISHRAITLRTDTTPQIARLARTRLSTVPRPLRLSYACSCVHISDHYVAKNREFDQVGIELLGPDSPEADAEVFVLATDALHRIGVTQLCIDLTLPRLTSLMMDHAGIVDPDRASLLDGISRKDIASVTLHGGPIKSLLQDLIKSAGDLEKSLGVVKGHTLSPTMAGLVERLITTIGAIRSRLPTVRLTIDLVDFRGLHYELGLSGSIHSLTLRAELGRAGRYLSGGGESGVGVTLYPDAIRKVLDRPPRRDTVILQPNTPIREAERLRALGYAVAGPLSVDHADTPTLVVDPM